MTRNYRKQRMNDHAYAPLGQRALDTLLNDLPRVFAAYEAGRIAAPMHAQWLNWHLIARLAHEVAYYRALHPAGSSVRKQRIAEGAYSEEEYFDT